MTRRSLCWHLLPAQPCAAAPSLASNSCLPGKHRKGSGVTGMELQAGRRRGSAWRGCAGMGRSKASRGKVGTALYGVQLGGSECGS